MNLMPVSITFGTWNHNFDYPSISVRDFDLCLMELSHLNEYFLTTQPIQIFIPDCRRENILNMRVYVQRISDNSGDTIIPAEFTTSGVYSVTAINDDRNITLQYNKKNLELVEKFMKLLAISTYSSVGYWVDTESEIIQIECVRAFDSLQDCLDRAIKEKQKAIYHSFFGVLWLNWDYINSLEVGA